MKLKQSFPRKNVIVALIVLSLPLFSGFGQEMPSLILDRAFSNFFNGEYDKAAEYFERYTKAEGDQEAPLRYLAQIYSAKGDLKKSIDCLERGVKVAPDSIESMLLLAEAYLKVNQPGNSIKTLDKVLEIDEFNVRALHFQAYLHQQKNDSRKTASYFKRLIVAVRNGAGSEQFLQSAYTFLGNYYYQRQEFLRAVDYYEKLVQVDEGTGRSLLVLGELYKITGQFDKSLQTMNLLIQKNPGNVSAHESRVETLYILNDRSTLDRIQILKTKSAKLNSLVEAFQLQIEKKTDESLVLVREFLKENPSRLSGHICLLRNMQNLQAQGKIDPVEVRNEAYAIMILAQRLGAHQLALDYADLVFPVLYKQANDSNFNLTFFQADRSASKLNSVHEQIAIDHMELYESHSVTQENLQKITHAIIYRREAIRYARQLKEWYLQEKNDVRVNEINSKIYYNLSALAWLLQTEKGKRPVAALKNLQTAIDLRPDLPNAHFIRGIVYYSATDKKVQNYVKARQEFGTAVQKSIQKGGDHAVPANYYFYEGMSLEKNNQWQKAEQSLKKAIHLDPHNATYLNYLGYMYSLRNTNLPEARQLLLQALEDDPESEAYLDSYGWILFQMGKPREALHRLVQAFHEAGRKNVTDAVIYYHLAETYAALKDYELSEFYYQKTLEHIHEASEPLDKKQIEKKIETLKIKQKSNQKGE